MKSISNQLPIINKNKLKFSVNKKTDTFPSLMNNIQKNFLFSFALSFQPSTYLEIGTAKGGSALIVNEASKFFSGNFRGVCIDLNFNKILIEHRKELEKKFTFIESPMGIRAIQSAAKICNKFDMILIDALHDHDNVVFDIMTSYPYLNEGGYIFLDDANYFGVKDGVESFLKISNAIDLGLVSRLGSEGKSEISPNYVKDRIDNNKDCIWGGLRILRKPMGSIKK